ncbi:MAG: hypothetical protein EZS28_055525, partial [Streblomastix strix]
MILLTEAANQEKDRDQEVIQGQENIRIQEKLQTRAIMDLRLGMNKEVEVEERIEDWGTIIKERTKNPINWIRTQQYEGESWDENPNDEWTKRTQMQKDPPDNHNDKDSTWTEDEAPQHHATPPQPKQPAQQTQRV